MKYMTARELCTLVATSLIMCSCSSTEEPSPKGQEAAYLDRAGYLAEFERAKDRLRLPVGSSWEKAVPEAPEGDVRFARGVGTTDAELYWFCEWEKAWLAARDHDPKKADAAMDQLTQIFDLQVYLVAFDDAGRAHTREIIRRAQQGDPSGVQGDVEINCRKS